MDGAAPQVKAVSRGAASIITPNPAWADASDIWWVPV